MPVNVSITSRTPVSGGVSPFEFFKIGAGTYSYTLVASADDDVADDAIWHPVSSSRFTLNTTATRYIHFRLNNDDDKNVLLRKMPLNATQDTEDLS